MLKGLTYLTEKGKRAIIGASCWLAAFQIMCMVPMVLIIHVFSKMVQAYKSGTSYDYNLPLYIIFGTVLIKMIN